MLLASGARVDEGVELTPSHFAHGAPVVSFHTNASSLYTLVLSDPDAPSVADPKHGEWIHWAVCNMPFGDALSGDAFVEFAPLLPGKDAGKHRYVVVLYEQSRGAIAPQLRISRRSGFPPRRSFNSRAFSEEHGLLPRAVLTFRAEYDDSVPALAASIQPEVS